jgi:chromosome segregation ATPase
LGLFIIPAKKRQAKADLREKIAKLRQQLSQSLRTQFEHEIERGMANINDAIAPYTRFVRAEQSKLEEVETKLNETNTGLENLKVLVEEVVSP